MVQVNEIPVTTVSNIFRQITFSVGSSLGYFAQLSGERALLPSIPLGSTHFGVADLIDIGAGIATMVWGERIIGKQIAEPLGAGLLTGYVVYKVLDILNITPNVSVTQGAAARTLAAFAFPAVGETRGDFYRGEPVPQANYYDPTLTPNGGAELNPNDFTEAAMSISLD